MKKIKYFKIPNQLKIGILAILIYYIAKHYSTIELYKYFIISVPLIGYSVMSKINEKYVKWDDKIIKLKTPGNKIEVVINVQDVTQIRIEEKKGITLSKVDNSTYIIPFQNLGRNFDVDVEIITDDFSKMFSHLIQKSL